MGRVELKGLHFKAYHGYYEEERERGNHFEVDITVTTKTFEDVAANDDLSKAVDYEQLYAIVKKEMQISSALLESVVVRIANKVLSELDLVESVRVSLSKLNPPIKGECKSAKVTYEKSRS